MLVTTTKCPNCVIAKRLLDAAGIAYEAINADENPAFAKEHGILQAPTLLAFSGSSVTPMVGVSNIRAYINK